MGAGRALALFPFQPGSWHGAGRRAPSVGWLQMGRGQKPRHTHQLVGQRQRLGRHPPSGLRWELEKGAGQQQVRVRALHRFRCISLKQRQRHPQETLQQNVLWSCLMGVCWFFYTFPAPSVFSVKHEAEQSKNRETSEKQLKLTSPTFSSI